MLKTVLHQLCASIATKAPRVSQQEQYETLVKIGLFFSCVDGIEDEEEFDHLKDWLSSIPWEGRVTQAEFIAIARKKIHAILDYDERDQQSYMEELVSKLESSEIRNQAVTLAQYITQSDSIVCDKENNWLNWLINATEMRGVA